MSRISLVMATLGRVQEIEDFVRHLAIQTHKDYELIIVDQNPDDRLIQVINHARDLGISLLHIRQSEPNQCLARNTGLARAQGSIVAFPDDDCWYEADVLEKVLGRMNEPDAPECVVIRWLEQDPASSEPHTISNKLWRRFREVNASCITLFFKRDLLINNLGFDADLGLHSWYGGGEETDLVFRVMASDSRVVCFPHALVHHPINKLTRLPFLKAFSQSRKRARGTGALYAKHKLEVFVIFRGLLSPWVYTAKNLLNPAVAGVELGKAIGRLEGFSRWLFTKSGRLTRI